MARASSSHGKARQSLGEPVCGHDTDGISRNLPRVSFDENWKLDPPGRSQNAEDARNEDQLSGFHATTATSLARWLRALRKIGGDEVGNLGLGGSAKFADRVLNDPVRVRHAPVLSQMLEP